VLTNPQEFELNLQKKYYKLKLTDNHASFIDLLPSGNLDHVGGIGGVSNALHLKPGFNHL